MIEMLTVIAILAITLTALLGMINFSLSIQDSVRQITRANDLAQEAMEAVRSVRDNNGWNQITAGVHGLANSSGFWNLTGSDNVIDGFTRTVSITDVMRDASDNIVESGGVSDLDTKKITVSVVWEKRSRSHSIELITHLTNWKQ